MKSRARKFMALSQKLAKSLLALMLCVCLVFGYSYHRPVKAEAVASAVTVAGCVLVATAIAALGIGCSAALPTPEYNAACQHIWNGISSTVQQQVQSVQFSATAVKTELTQDFLHAVFNGVSSEYPNTVSYSSFDSMEKALHLGRDCVESYVDSDIVNMTNVVQLDRTFTPPITKGGEVVSFQAHNLNIKITSYNTWYWVINTISPLIAYSKVVDYSVYIGDSYAFCFPSSSEYAEIYFQTISDSVGHLLFVPAEKSYYSSAFRIDGVPDLYNTSDVVYNPSNKNLYADGYSVLNHPVDDVINKTSAVQGNSDKVINVTIPDAVAKGSSVTDATKAQTQATTTGQDMTDTAEKEKNATANTGRDTVPPKNPTMPDLMLPTGIQSKFPFCLPWDLRACYALFQVTPKAPCWDIPINIDNGAIRIHQTYRFDMNSQGVMDNALPVFKWFLNLMVVVGLIYLFKKIVS